MGFCFFTVKKTIGRILTAYQSYQMMFRIRVQFCELQAMDEAGGPNKRTSNCSNMSLSCFEGNFV